MQMMQNLHAALIMKSLANEFFQTMAEGAEQHHTQHADAYDLIVNGIKNRSAALDIFRTMLRRPGS